MLEIELKFRLVDESSFRAVLGELFATCLGIESQRDAYFNHPARDFAITDEAVRIRSVGGASHVTYKGPVQGTVAKTREEIEVGLESGDDFAQILTRLGFRPTLVVAKQRENWSVIWEHRTVNVCLDHVQDVGTFCELELVADSESAASTSEAERALWSLAERFGLSDPIRKSYLEMLLEK